MDLRTDGLYIQFGIEEWYNGFEMTSTCWYNIIKIINPKYAVVIGLSAFCPFFDLNYFGKNYKKNKMFHLVVKPNTNFLCYEPTNNQCSKCNNVISSIDELAKLNKPLHMWSLFGEHDDIHDTHKKITDVSNIKLNYTLMNFFNIENPDILEVVKFFSTYDFDSLLNDVHYRGIYLCELINYNSIDENYDPENILSLTHPYDDKSNEKYNYVKRFQYCNVNDSFEAVMVDNDNSKFYAWFSPCMAQRLNLESYNTTQQNTFAYYFIPFDLSSEETWRPMYEQWKILYDFSKILYDFLKRETHEEFLRYSIKNENVFEKIIIQKFNEIKELDTFKKNKQLENTIFRTIEYLKQIATYNDYTMQILKEPKYNCTCEFENNKLCYNYNQNKKNELNDFRGFGDNCDY